MTYGAKEVKAMLSVLWRLLKAMLSVLWRLLATNADGTLSSTKFWQAVGYVTATWVIVRLTLQDHMSAEYLLIYLGALTAARSFQNYLSSKGQAAKPSHE